MALPFPAFMIPAVLAATAVPAIPPATTGPLYELPPLIVEGLRWRHAAIPGYEILSCCPDETTESFVRKNVRQDEVLDEIVPARLRLRTAEPVTMILVDEAHVRKMAAEIVTEMEKAEVRTSVGYGMNAARAVGIAQLRLTDDDSTAIYFSLKDAPADQDDLLGSSGVGPMNGGHFEALILAPEYMYHLLVDRAPRLPAWYVIGTIRVYEAAAWYVDGPVLSQASWLSQADSDRVAGDPHAARALLPASELFGPPPPVVKGDERTRARRLLWAAEAELFVRWCFEGDGLPRRKALWRLAERAATGKVTEPLFRECFGMGFADLRDALSDDLPTAVAQPIHWEYEQAPAEPEVRLADATPADLHRIKGEWERREIGFIKDRYPALVPHYREIARRTLLQAYAERPTDPRVLSSLALLDGESGDLTGARSLLESAFRDGTPLRPCASIALADLRLEAAADDSNQPRRVLSPAQAAKVFDALRPALTRPPPLLAAYRIAVRASQRCSAPPTPEVAAILKEGVRLFPSQARLVEAAAVEVARTGDRAAATDMLALGAGNVESDAELRGIADLRRRLRLAAP